jgi:predicted GNAT family N-acyltransferase
MIVFRLAEKKQDYGWCVLIRTIVFEAEQNLPLSFEIDEYEDACRHFLALEDDAPFGTARWRAYAPDIAKIERVALLKDRRGRGLGLGLMQAVVDDILGFRAFRALRLSAQDYAIPFYEKAGFTVVGEGYLDAGLPHHMMERAV